MFEQLPKLDQVTAESLQASLIGMLHSLKSEAHHKQMEQLNRLGVARFLGSASTCRIWGVVRPSAKETSTHPTDHQSTVQSISARLTGKQSAALKTSTKPTGNQRTHKSGRPAGNRGDARGSATRPPAEGHCRCSNARQRHVHLGHLTRGFIVQEREEEQKREVQKRSVTSLD